MPKTQEVVEEDEQINSSSRPFDQHDIIEQFEHIEFERRRLETQELFDFINDKGNTHFGNKKNMKSIKENK